MAFERVLFRADNLCVTSDITVYDPVWAGGQNLRNIQNAVLFFDLCRYFTKHSYFGNWQTSTRQLQIMTKGGAYCQNIGHFNVFSFLL